MKDCSYCQNQRYLVNAFGEEVRCPACRQEVLVPVRAAEAMRAAIGAVEEARDLWGRKKEV